MARKNDGACAKSKQIKTDIDCRAAKFNEGAWSPAKISDMTRDGLYLFVTPGESKAGDAASKIWRRPPLAVLSLQQLVQIALELHFRVNWSIDLSAFRGLYHQLHRRDGIDLCTVDYILFIRVIIDASG